MDRRQGKGCSSAGGRKKETTKIMLLAFTCLWFNPNYCTWEKKGFYIDRKKKKELICVVFISQKKR